MGSSGLSYRLIPSGEPATTARVHKAVLATLGDVWTRSRNALLSHEWRQQAARWIFLGEDSLLTLEVHEGQMVFWFYDSVRWPQGIAEHWLLLALAAGRVDFELALRRLGYRVDPRDWPDLGTVLAAQRSAKSLFFETRESIGSISGDRVEWQIKDGDGDAASTPLSALEPGTRAAADALLASGRCRCGACQRLFGDPPPEPRPASGFRVEPVAVLATPEVRLLAHLDDWILATGGYTDPTWVRRAASLDGPWETIDELTDPSRHLELLARAGRRIVAHFRTNSGGRALSTSDDGGRTWTAKAPHPQIPKLKNGRVVAGAEPGEVWMIGAPPKEILHSTDGGQSFDVVARAPTVDGEPIAGFHALLPRPDRIVAVPYTKATASGRVAVSTDGAATFRRVAIAGLEAARRLGARGEALFALGAAGGSVVVARSRDGVGSWTVTKVGPGSVAGMAVGPRGLIVGTEVRDGKDDGVFVSADGERFERAVAPGTAQVFADPTGASEGLFVVGRTLGLLRRG